MVYTYRVFCLNLSVDVILERLTLRQTDHVSGERYHVLYNPPKVKTVKDRLKTNPKDKDAEVRRSLVTYQHHCEEILEYYGKQVMHINADQQAHGVFELIECMLIHPTATCIAPTVDPVCRK